MRHITAMSAPIAMRNPRSSKRKRMPTRMRMMAIVAQSAVALAGFSFVVICATSFLYTC